MTPEDWADHARLAVIDVAGAHADWTSDEVWAQLEDWGVDRPDPWEPRALGAVMRGLQSQGLILKLGSMQRPSKRPERNHGMVAVWTSPGWAWQVPDAVPVARSWRDALVAYAMGNDLTLQAAGERAIKLLVEG